MADYKEQAVVGRRWLRCHSVRISNPMAGKGVPAIAFSEQEVVDIGGRVIEGLPGAPREVHVTFDPAAAIDVYDPATGMKTGATATHAEVYGLLFSAYMTAAAARDEADRIAAEKEAARLAQIAADARASADAAEVAARGETAR